MLRFLSFMAVALAAGLCLPSQVDAQSSYGAHSYTVTRTRTVGPWRARLFERRQARRAASSHGTYGVMQSSGSQGGYGSYGATASTSAVAPKLPASRECEGDECKKPSPFAPQTSATYERFPTQQAIERYGAPWLIAGN